MYQMQIVEAAKTRGERSLTEKQEKVQIEIEKCHRRVEEFAECSDLSLMQQYCKDVAGVQRRLGELQEQIVQINREEELFKWTPSTYPQLDSIHGMLEPYQKLFTTVFRWQKAERKFMDGAFLELNAENTQAEVRGACACTHRYTCGMYVCVCVCTCVRACVRTCVRMY